MESRHIRALKDFAHAQSDLDAPSFNRSVLLALEAFGRERLSTNFFMRDFLYSEISAVHGIPNIPSNPERAIEAGSGLCEHLLEPLLRTFGHVVVPICLPKQGGQRLWEQAHPQLREQREQPRKAHLGLARQRVPHWGDRLHRRSLVHRHRALQGDPGLAPARLVHPRPPAVFGNGLLREERRLQSDLA